MQEYLLGSNDISVAALGEIAKITGYDSITLGGTGTSFQEDDVIITLKTGLLLKP